MKKIYANKGIRRNKKPLKNIVWVVEVAQLKEHADKTNYKQFKYKEEGYLILYSKKQSTDSLCWHGFITPENLKTKIGGKQWSKFCQGKREFITQRRINKKNL